MKNNKDLSNKILLEVLRKEYFELAAQEDISPTPENKLAPLVPKCSPQT